LLADADLIHYTSGASEKDEEAISKAVDCSTTARRQTVGWPGPACEGRFWERKLGPAKAHTCRGQPTWENPTYSAFWSGFGATCVRLQRVASSVGFGTTARLGPRKNGSYSGVTPEP